MSGYLGITYAAEVTKLAPPATGGIVGRNKLEDGIKDLLKRREQLLFAIVGGEAHRLCEANLALESRWLLWRWRAPESRMFMLRWRYGDRVVELFREGCSSHV